MAGLEMPPAIAWLFSMSPMETHHSGMPATNSRVPSIGSTTPNPRLLQPRQIVDTFLGKPAFPVPQKNVAKCAIGCPVGLNDRIISQLEINFHRARDEGRDGSDSYFERLLNAPQNLRS